MAQTMYTTEELLDEIDTAIQGALFSEGDGLAAIVSAGLYKIGSSLEPEGEVHDILWDIKEALQTIATQLTYIAENTRKGTP